MRKIQLEHENENLALENYKQYSLQFKIKSILNDVTLQKEGSKGSLIWKLVYTEPQYYCGLLF